MLEKGDNKQPKKILVYDCEEGETTRCFIEAFKRHCTTFEFQDFKEANDQDKDTLYIIAVVRHTSIRVTETLSDVKEKFDEEHVKNLKRVIVTYIYGDGPEEELLRKIKQISKTGQVKFATIVPIDFSDKSLMRWKRVYVTRMEWFLKQTNKDSLEALKRLVSKEVRTDWLVDVYEDVPSPHVEEFIAVLRQYISSSINLQDVKPLKRLKNVTSPTLICTTGDVDECQEKLKQKDLKEVFLCHIIDIENVSTKSGNHDSADDKDRNPSSASPAGAVNNTTQHAENMPWNKAEILYYNEKFKFDLDFIKQFETFVRTWSVEIKPPSE